MEYCMYKMKALLYKSLFITGVEENKILLKQHVVFCISI